MMPKNASNSNYRMLVSRNKGSADLNKVFFQDLIFLENEKFKQAEPFY